MHPMRCQGAATNQVVRTGLRDVLGDEPERHPIAGTLRSCSNSLSVIIGYSVPAYAAGVKVRQIQYMLGILGGADQ